MKLEDIQSLAEKELRISEDLGLESKKNTDLFLKFLKIHSTEKLVLLKMQNSYNKLLLQRRQYYLGQGSVEDYRKEPQDIKVLRQDADLYLNADSLVSKEQLALGLQKEKVECTEAILKHIQNRGFQISKMIEWQKFTNGVN